MTDFWIHERHRRLDISRDVRMSVFARRKLSGHSVYKLVSLFLNQTDLLLHCQNLKEPVQDPVPEVFSFVLSLSSFFYSAQLTPSWLPGLILGEASPPPTHPAGVESGMWSFQQAGPGCLPLLCQSGPRRVKSRPPRGSHRAVNPQRRKHGLNFSTF